MVLQRIKNSINYINTHCYPVITMLIMLVMATGSYYYYVRHNVPEKGLHLVTKIAKNRIERLEAFLSRQASFATLVASHAVIQDTLSAFDKASEDSFAVLKVFLEEAGTAENYYNTLLADAGGKVLFSNFDENYVGVELFKKPGSESPLGSKMLRARMTATYNNTDFAFDPVLKQPALFFIAPVYKNSNLMGFVAQKASSQAIYNIIEDYLLLGTHGDISVGIKNQDGILFIDQSRSLEVAPFKRFISNDNLTRTITEKLLTAALQGYQGKDVLNENKQPTAFSWHFVPRLNWGIVILQPLSDFLTDYHYLRLVILILTLLCLLLATYKAITLQWVSRIHTSLKSLWVHHHIRIRIIQIFLFSIILISIVMTFLFIKDMHQQLSTMKNNAKKITHFTKEKTIELVNQIELVGKSLEHDLTQEIFNKNNLVSHLKRDLVNHPLIYGITVAFAPYAYAPDKRLFAPYVIRDGEVFITEYYDQIYDYTQEKTVIGSSWPWYTKPIKTGTSMWFDPYWEKMTEKPILLVSYSLPFFAQHDTEKKQPIGVINIAMDVSHIQKNIEHIFLGNTGYGLMFSSDGTLLYYPQKKYVAGNESIMDLAREEGNKGLLAVVNKILQGNMGFYSYHNPNTNALEWMYTEEVPSTKWILGIVFSEVETVLSILSVRHYSIALLILIMLFSIFVSWSLSKHFWDQHYRTNLLTIVLLIGQLALLLIIRFTPVFQLKKEMLKISDQTHVNKYIQDAQEYAKNIHEPQPQALPLGLYLSSVRFPNSTLMQLTGYIWEKTTDKDKDLIREPVFTQALKPAEFRKIYTTQENDTILVCWKFFVELSQKLNFTQYPFDAIKIVVELEHPDYSKNIILTPIVESYSNEPFQENSPTLSSAVNLTGFKVLDAFFAFQETKPMRLGVENLDAPYKTQTVYEINMVRNLMYDFIIFILPLLIIYFLLYTIIIITSATKKTKELFTLSAYTGLIFVAILLHRTLREQYVTGSILYIEYLFFLLYVSFILIVLYTSLDLQENLLANTIRKIFYVFHEYFWPLQLTALFIITIFSFYHT